MAERLFAPTNMNVSAAGFESDYGFFDGVLNPSAGSKSVAGGASAFKATSMMAAGIGIAAGGLQIQAQTASSMAQIDNIFRNVDRTKRNIDQIEKEMMDTLDVQVRKVSRRHGTQMARVGASGVGFYGSPLLIMAESYARGMEDYDAIEEKGRFTIDSAYMSIYDSLDQAVDIADSISRNAMTTLVGTIGNAASVL